MYPWPILSWLLLSENMVWSSFLYIWVISYPSTVCHKGCALPLYLIKNRVCHFWTLCSIFLSVCPYLYHCLGFCSFLISFRVRLYVFLSNFAIHLLSCFNPSRSFLFPCELQNQLDNFCDEVFQDFDMDFIFSIDSF